MEGGEGSNSMDKHDDNDAQQLHYCKKTDYMTLNAYLTATHVVPWKPCDGTLIHGLLT
jgi:hypothetical protein